MEILYYLYKPIKFVKHQLIRDGFWTTINLGHRHSWNPKTEFTTRNGFHIHKIDKKRKLALPDGIITHTHKLLKS